VREPNPWFVVRSFEAEIWVEPRVLFKVADMYNHGGWCTALACLREEEEHLATQQCSVRARVAHLKLIWKWSSR
jgi:hypothetical protein